MQLKYVGCPYPRESRHFYELPEFVVGEAYEVAEIFEMDGHLMARPPGTRHWPRPGEARFGIHPEWFEPIDEPIPIESCGYEYNDYLCDFFGVLLDDVGHIEIVKRLRAMSKLEHDSRQAFEAWCLREASDLSTAARAAVVECLWSDQPVEFNVIRDVFRISTAVGENAATAHVPFAYFGCSGDTLFRRDIRHAEYREWLRGILSALDIETVSPEVLQYSYWRGKGNPRLINPRSRERFLYGIAPVWSDDEDEGQEVQS